jgi:citronellol/citronellal dehydrogenase
MGTEGEIAASVIFLLSPAAAYISGATLKVDGASSLYRLQGYVIPDHEPWEKYSAFADDGEE